MQTANSPSPRRRILWLIPLGIVAVLLAVGVFEAVALPGCASCHDQKAFVAATAASQHAKVDCRACHVPAGSLARLAYGFGQPLHVLAPRAGGAQRDAAAVPDSRCLACHGEIEDNVVTANGIRIDHKSCAQGSTCSDCHSTTAHGKATAWVRAYDMNRCLVCHVKNEQIKCDLCHEGRPAASRIKSGSFSITHGPQWRTTHGLGDAATCMVCHTSADCFTCHGPGVPHEAKFIESHSAAATDKAAKCNGCHAQTFCDGCHGLQMPHGPQFTRDHAKLAAKNPALCKRCHAGKDCTGCHDKHVHPGGSVGGVTPKRGGQ